MGQAIATRTEVRGILICRSPVHVGGWDSTAEANLTVARDGLGRPVLPGTSIAGALRAYLARLDRFSRGHRLSVLDDLFGPEEDPRSGPDADDRVGSPSWIRIDDAPLIGPDLTPVVRDGVGIDRRSGSAAVNFLYTRQVLPVGATFAFRLVADTPAAAAPVDYPGGWPALVQEAVQAMAQGLAHGQVPIGAGRGRGLGRVELHEVTVRQADLSDPAGLVAWLTGKAHAARLSLDRPPADGRLRIAVEWQPTSPLLVRDSLSGTVVDALPLTDTDTGRRVRLLLPGSSLRGAIRAYAERIVRTLQGREAPDSFGEALRHPPPVVDVLFGSAPANADAATAGSGKGWRGVLTVADCRSTSAVDATRWKDVVTTTPAQVRADGQEEREQRGERNLARDTARSELQQRLAAIRDDVALTITDHVAIDRWTGGAADHRLFSVLDPDTTVAWESIKIEVDAVRLHQHKSTEPKIALALLLLLLRDLRDGWLSIGYGTTRGRGQVHVTRVRFDGAELPEPWRALTGRTLDQILADPPPEVTEAMTRWREMFQEAAA